MLTQVIRFTLPSPSTISASGFSSLRRSASAAGAAAQYYGYTVPTRSYPLPREKHEICWVIEWPASADRGSVMAELKDLSAGDATSLLFQFADSQASDLRQAFEAPVCEFACISISSDAPLEDSALQTSMHKTYTDTYKIRGFTGGHWSYASNTNETHGVPSDVVPEPRLAEGDRRLGVYFLGWESIELHEDGTGTPEFSEEIDKLRPYFGPGTGAWYAILRKHQ